ncbi:hypothetical protein [Pseudozobellia thermophila]|nr:hypothetical protein [Pseudozobellia thermophila]
MKILRNTGLIALLLCSNYYLSAQVARQENSPGEGQANQNTIKEVEQINQASEEISATASNTTDAVKSTVSNSREALNEIKSLFGPGKTKRAKGTVTIGIAPITYDDPDLNALYEHIIGVKGAKSPNKNFSNGSVTITVEYKDKADALWQSLPTGVRSPFKMVQMSDDQIVVQHGDTP